MGRRHQPPQRGASAEPDRAAVELVEQQEVLGIAVAAGLLPVFAFVLAEAGDVDQETVHLAALAARPVLDQRALAAQLLRAGLQFWGMADPEVEIALFLLGQAPQAAHQEQAVDRLLCGFLPAWLVDKRAGQALGFGEYFVVRFETAQARWRAGRQVARQQRMVDVEQQR